MRAEWRKDSNPVKSRNTAKKGKTIQRKSSHWVLVENYNRLDDALMAQSALRGSGIDSEVPDQQTVSTVHFYNSVIGGVRLMVHPNDLAKAREVLELPPLGPEPTTIHCPQCGSANTHALPPGIIEIVKTIVIWSFRNSGIRYMRQKCEDCGHKFRPRIEKEKSGPA